MSDRHDIYDAIKSALAPLEERTEYPEWQDDLVYSNIEQEGSLWDQFSSRLSIAKGTAIDSIEVLGAWLNSKGYKTGYCDPSVAEKVKSAFSFQDITVLTEFDRDDIDKYEFGITRATGAIAESGTIILNDKDTTSRLAALAPWVHIAIIDKEMIYPYVADAVNNLGDDPSIIWATGPSKTADVEGILIEGVHGPCFQIACLLN